MENPKKPNKVGLIGCGAIGTIIAEAFERNLIQCDELIVYDYEEQKAAKLKKLLHFPVTVVSSVDEMIKRKPKVIVEAASQQAARDYVKMMLAAGIEPVIMSTGALLDLNIDKGRVHIPSGAIGGLDAIASAALAGIDEIILTSRKNPKALEMNNKEAQTVYQGYAEEAARLFPKEMNVAATLALTVKSRRVKVQVISDPMVSRNTHEIYMRWKFGEMFLRFSNDPHPENPRTSALAAWSAIELLQTLLNKAS